jgi:hypothetical protein
VRRGPPATQLNTDVLDLAGLITSAPIAAIDVAGAVRVVGRATVGSAIVGAIDVAVVVGAGSLGGRHLFCVSHTAPPNGCMAASISLRSTRMTRALTL